MDKSFSADSGRVESRSPNPLAEPDIGLKFANDSLDQLVRGKGVQAARRPYMTLARVRVIAQGLSQRERVVLSDVARLGLVSGQQLQQLHFPLSESGRRIARLEIARLCDAQVLERLGRRIGGTRAGSRGYLLALGTAGQRIVWPNRRRYRQPWTPNPSYVSHSLAISQLYVDLRQMFGERLLVYDTEPACWRRSFSAGGAPGILKADSFVVLDHGQFEDRYFVEIDCGTESGTRILEKARMYVRYWHSGREEAESGVFPWVMWVANSEKRRELIVETLSRLRADDWEIFKVTIGSEAANRMTMQSMNHIAIDREEVKENELQLSNDQNR